MKFTKTKIILFAFIFITIFFFANDIGIIDIEKTAIIVAIGVDKIEDKFCATCEIAVPEATDINSENKKTIIKGFGSTIGEAIKQVGTNTGWYPQLYFCNLIIIGNNLLDTNTIKIVDYFATTLRVQDSAIIVTTDGNASELLSVASPLDAISSFALQKVILKEDGFDKDSMVISIKDFAKDYYSKSTCSYMPLIKMNKDSSEKVVFTVFDTAIFQSGVYKGTLSKDLTFSYNLINKNCKGSSITIKDVLIDNEKQNLLLIVQKNCGFQKILEENNKLFYDINLNIVAKISDKTSSFSDSTFEKNNVLPDVVIDALKKQITNNINNLIEYNKSTCDFMKLQDNLYKFHYDLYSQYKDEIKNITPRITVDISGQK